MRNDINYIDSNEWKHIQKSSKIMTSTVKTITIWALASLMLACTENNWPIIEPIEPYELKNDTTPPGIKIVISDTTKTYTYDITIDPTQNTQ